MFQTANKQKGLALPAAIFIMIILSSLGAGLVLLTQNTNQKTGLDLLNTKTIQAAKAGLEYGLYKANKENICNPALQEISLDGNFLKGFKASFKCELTVQNEGGTDINFYKITAYGCHTSSECPISGTPTAEYTEKMITSLMAK